MTDKNPLAHYSGVLSEAVQESAAEQTPVSGQSRLHGQKWTECSVEHVAMVLTALHEWEGYEVRYLYAAPVLAAPAAVAAPAQALTGEARAEAIKRLAPIRAKLAAAASAVAVPDERAAFEKWASFVGYSIKRWQADANLYEEDVTEDAWEAWKARAALAATPAAVPTYIEVRECSECGHIGINDADSSKAACSKCDWQGDSPVEDKCPDCNTVGTMTAACSKCGARASLLAETTLHAEPIAPAAAAPVVLPERDAAVKEVMGLVRQYGSDRVLMRVAMLSENQRLVSEFSESSSALDAAIESKLLALLAGVSAPAAQAVPAFCHVASLKLKSLQERGYQITGYALEKPVEGAQPERGFINHGGFVGWWWDGQSPQAQADARDAERYRWLRNESWACYNLAKKKPEVALVAVTRDGAGNIKTVLAEDAMDESIDAAIAAKAAQQTQGGGNA